MPLLTKHQAGQNYKLNEISDNPSVIYPLKDTSTTLEKRSKDHFSDAMELTLSMKIHAGQQTTYCYVTRSGCVQ